MILMMEMKADAAAMCDHPEWDARRTGVRGCVNPTCAQLKWFYSSLYVLRGCLSLELKIHGLQLKPERPNVSDEMQMALEGVIQLRSKSTLDVAVSTSSSGRVKVRYEKW